MNIIVIGAFSEVFESLEDNNINIVGYIDFTKVDYYKKHNWLGTDDIAQFINIRYPKVEIVISPDLPEARYKLYNLYSKYSVKFHTFINNQASISASSIINYGTFVQKFAHISSNTNIGKLVKVNVGANIMHDCTIGSFTTIAPNAVILGNVHIGNCCYIGANSTILPNVIIGNNVIVGAGSVVTKDIKDNSIVKGVPAK